MKNKLNQIQLANCGLVNKALIDIGLINPYLRAGKGDKLCFDFEKLIELLKENWHWKDYVIYEDGLLQLHTGGWSGNETLIDALRLTTLWIRCYRGMEVGGHYYFKLKSGKFDFKMKKVKI